MVLVVVLPIFVVALIVIVARYITTVAFIVIVTVAVTVAVFFAFSIARRPLFVAYPGAVLLPAVRTTAVVLFVAAFFIRGTGFLVGR